MQIQTAMLIANLPDGLLEPFWHLVIILFGLGLLTPKIWVSFERIWWRLNLGNSTTARIITQKLVLDFNLLIREQQIDRGAARPLAVVMAIPARIFEIRRLTADARESKAERLEKVFESSIDQLNKLWREGTPPEILWDYINTIRNAAKDPTIEKEAQLRGLCAISVVIYALGKLRESNELGKKNWQEAKRRESNLESELKWTASYGYFNSTLLLGCFKSAMSLMADQWTDHYSKFSASDQALLRRRMCGRLILNPILAIPRHIILGAAFNETPFFAEKYWPSASVYHDLNPKQRECKLKWVQAWYDEAKQVCEGEPTSLHFTHAYTGFYYTLILLEPEAPMEYLHGQINQAFNAIDDDAAIVAQYVKYGFSGVYHLVCGRNEEALDNLSRASSYAAISGNRFADCIFMCCHAVAAARLNRSDRYLEPDINYYLRQAERMARTINRDFYKRLCDAAHAAVCWERGEKLAAERYALRSRQGEAGNRILSVFANPAPGMQAGPIATDRNLHKPNGPEPPRE